MNTYLDLHRAFSAHIEAELEATLTLPGGSSDSVRHAVRGLLRHQPMKYPLSVLPLLVHGAETGSPAPALPLSAVHVLWWTSACFLDDLADGHSIGLPAGLGVDKALLAAVVTGHVLPLRAVHSPRIPHPIRGALTTEILDCGTAVAEGQLGNMRSSVEHATRSSVVTAYRGKSRAPFDVITAIAALLSGAGGERTGLWREFCYVFGVLWQLFNDQEDITSGRNEDQSNGTATYLLACALEEAPPLRKMQILELHTAAPTSAESRSELAGILLAPSVLTCYAKNINEFRDEAHHILNKLGGDDTYLPVLRHLVDQTSQLLL
ncbi:polyprenyl synthetase family protein [Streptomyces chiangmaiensis]|uniref:Polyprenyl synthetase n=1 Tax=Streptomyces chiangmaiensis TaxID=766497 RepID=A0ABU7FKG4_9ACTN|nr:hypothetical protein [Streptomyces chiangmaiensis]MED7824461.1 hypothetical protein [Streptomyces chiangmaiensis]